MSYCTCQQSFTRPSVKAACSVNVYVKMKQKGKLNYFHCLRLHMRNLFCSNHIPLKVLQICLSVQGGDYIKENMMNVYLSFALKHLDEIDSTCVLSPVTRERHHGYLV